MKSDPISSRDERKLVKHIEAELDEHLTKIADAGFDRVVGTSGTILSLGAIATGESERAAARFATGASRPSRFTGFASS